MAADSECTSGRRRSSFIPTACLCTHIASVIPLHHPAISTILLLSTLAVYSPEQSICLPRW